MNPIITFKMEYIKTIFQTAQENASMIEDMTELISLLEANEKEFLSVAYEGAAMGLALKDFAINNSYKNWSAFLEPSKKHSPQVYIGMGWAVAQEKRDISALEEKLPANMQFRIWDGCGYFDGIFRQRQTIKSQNRLEYIPEKNYKAYDEGLGRSIWYICKGDETKVPEIIKTFAAERQSDLWRGIGIACSYVGGFEENALKSLKSSAEIHSTQLGIGAAMVAESRIVSDCFTKDIELVNRVFNNLSAEEAMDITVRNKSIDKFVFGDFVLQMETSLKNSRQIKQ